MFRNQLFAVAATCTLSVSAIPSNLGAQQTTLAGGSAGGQFSSELNGVGMVLKMAFPTTASADWITMGIGGQYAFLSSGDVVEVKLAGRTPTANLK